MALIAIDFDHTIRKADNTPCAGVKDGISLLREKGHKILIHSCNNPAFIEKWLNDQDIRFDYIWGQDGANWGQKPVCALYIDDRAYTFPMDGDWTDEIPGILRRLEQRGDPSNGF